MTWSMESSVQENVVTVASLIVVNVSNIRITSYVNFEDSERYGNELISIEKT
jgi:hypothetical protein